MTRVGIQISSVKKYLQTPEDVRSSFLKVGAIGYRVIQIQWVSPAVPDAVIRDALEEASLECVGTQDYTHEVLPRLDAVIAQNRLWGGKYVCISGIPEAQMNPEGCAAFGRELTETAKKVRDAGMALIFHPRYQEFAPFGGATGVRILMDNTPPDFQLELDVFHAHKAGLDPAALIREYEGRMDLVHFKDMGTGANGEVILTPVGQGLLDWDAIIGACVDTGIKVVLAEQESWQKDAFECLGESFSFIVSKGVKP